MRRALIFLLCAVLLLGGCALPSDPEDYAYVLVLGIDAADDGGVRLTARIPRVGSSGDSSPGQDAKEPSGPYLVFSAEGASLPRAVTELAWRIPRPLNLSHVKLLIVSREIAVSERFPEMLSSLSRIHHFSTAAHFAVCAGNAGRFIASQQTVIGSRLSSEIQAMLSDSVREGYIPDASVADVVFSMHSICPVCAVALAYESDSELPAIDDPKDNRNGLLFPGKTQASREEEASEHFYLGAAILRDGRMCAELNGERTLLCNMLTNHTRFFGFEWNGQSYELALERAASLRVQIHAGDVRLGADVLLTTVDDLEDAEANAVALELETRLSDLIRYCQSLSVDPFGFAEIACRRFGTVQRWMDFDWQERFASAEIDVRVAVKTRRTDSLPEINHRKNTGCCGILRADML